MRLAALFAATLLVCAASAPQAFSQQQTAVIDARATANSIATLVEENYFDPTRAHTIAAALRARAQAGAYDRFTNPLELAGALTTFLHPFDGHFAVINQPAPAAGPAQAGAPPPGLVARQNYGFRRAEMLPGGIGYILVDQFAGFDPNANPPPPARRAADNAIAMVAGARAIILDLRDSRGGAPAMVAYLASYFVPADANIFNTFHSRRGTGSEAPVGDPTGPRLLTPLYILVNGGTGSASESLPYTLQAAGRAIIVGEPSNGRANPGGFFPTPQGLSVFISLGAPVNPITHGNWEGAGVVPNIAVASSDALPRAQIAALEALLAADTQGEAAAETRWTLEALRAAPQPLSAEDAAAYAGAYGDVSVENAGGRLILHQGRRATEVTRLDQDVFVSADPLRRVRFDREGGRVVAVTLLSPAGPLARFLRT